MKTIVVYFEIGGKKMKMTVQAKDNKAAKEIVKGKIIFHKLQSSEEQMFSRMNDIFGGIFKK